MYNLFYVKAEDGIQDVHKPMDDSGFDLRANEDLVIDVGERALIRTGLRFQVPSGCEIQIRSRSGLAYKHGVFVLNSPGTVDKGYTGEVKIILMNMGEHPFEINKGDRIAQGVVVSLPAVSVEETDQIIEGVRGSKGFGSTGVK